MKEWGRLGARQMVFEILSQLGRSQIEGWIFLRKRER